MHKFNEKSLQLGFIGNFLYNYWLPTCDTVKHHEYIHESFFYIYNNSIIQCTSSGFIGLDAEYKTIQSYLIGEKYRKNGNNFICKDDYYSSEIHKRLVEFAYKYSDITDINLRPYINFHINKFITNIFLYYDDESGYQLIDNTNNYKCVLVPIRFNHKYTIAIDCPSMVYMVPVFYSHDRKLMIYKNKVQHDISTEFLTDTNQIFRFTQLTYQNPEIVEVSCQYDIADKYYKYYKNLYLLIQLPGNNLSSITVLEGDYRNQLANPVINTEYIDNMTDEEMNDLFTNDLSLLKFNTKESYPYTNRFLEFLYDTVIDYTWKLDGNITSAQKLLTNARYDNLKFGIWDNLTRYRMYEFNKNSPHKHTDVCGYIDKDTEEALMKSLNNYKGDF